LDLLLLTAEPNPGRGFCRTYRCSPTTLRTAPPDVFFITGGGQRRHFDCRRAAGPAGSARSVPLAGLDRPLDPGGGRGQRGAAWWQLTPTGGLDEILLPGNRGLLRSMPGCDCSSGRRGNLQDQEGVGKISLGELVIDEGTYTARLRGAPTRPDLQRIRAAQVLGAARRSGVHPAPSLLHEVWGYDFFGGTRTVDVHVRRLRAKLGPEYESLIGTVRNVGYKAVRPTRGRPPSSEPRRRRR